MLARTSNRGSCHKRGVVLTCYVNGRKRFRAVPLDVTGEITLPNAGFAPRRTDRSSGTPFAASGE